jgi:transglutaminase-like putative cysteine protease
MKRIRIVHHTEYHYKEPVEFGPHRALLRPREGHELHLDRISLTVEPEAEIRWMRDPYDNSITKISFSKPGAVLRIHAEMDVSLYTGDSAGFPIAPAACRYPFQYPAEEQLKTMIYRVPSYPHDGPAVRAWLEPLYQPGQLADTLDLLDRVNTRIHDSFQYIRREEPGVQLPCQTLAKGTGSCRDYAVFMMEAARHLGFASRFVTGYIQMGEGQHGATHAWTEVYLPGAGWQGFDPTNHKRAGDEHVSVAVAREQEMASPLSGSWSGPADAFDRMEVRVEVAAM